MASDQYIVKRRTINIINYHTPTSYNQTGYHQHNLNVNQLTKFQTKTA